MLEFVDKLSFSGDIYYVFERKELRFREEESSNKYQLRNSYAKPAIFDVLKADFDVQMREDFNYYDYERNSFTILSKQIVLRYFRYLDLFN